MWLLTCDGDLFEGKRLWLRPGTTHLLGRTSGRSEAGERIRYINHKSVSRKHLTIEIGPVKAGDSSKLYSRSEIKLIDGSKIGTTVNGEKITQSTKTLDGRDYTIKLGSYEPLFHISWHPVTLSFTSLSKKSKGDPLATWREKLDQTDIKVISDYVTNETTHTIAKKRNTPAALQALLQGQWLVTEGFVDDLAVAVERRTTDGTTLLEDNFDGYWPKEAEHLIPAGNEPQPRGNDYLKPDPDRAEIFLGYVFVFLSQIQYDTLLPVITAGSGKALLWEVNIGESKFEDVVQYVKEVAGHKNSEQFRLSQQTGRGGVVVVRLNDRDAEDREFIRSIDRALDQRSVEQNEFLDAVLTKDTRNLRRELPEEPDSPSAAAKSRRDSRPQTQPRQQEQRAVTVPDSPPPAEQERAPEQAPTDTSAATKRRNRRIITQSRFKGFDDFDPSQFSKPASQSPAPSFENREPSQAPSEHRMDVDDTAPAAHTQQSSRKRPAPTQEQDEEDMYATILTGHAAMKRQKTAAGQNGAGSSAKTPSAADRRAAEKAGRAKKKAKEMNVMAEVQARRQKEDEERKKDEEALRQALDGIDISEMKNLAKVEEMELPARDRPTRGSAKTGESERWDPAWNGRKNFKKFRPQGWNRDGPRLQRVIVTLEEVPRKGHGIGDEYWLNTSTTSRNKSKSQSQSQSVRQGAARSQRAEGEEDDPSRFRRRLQNSREQDEEDATVEQILPEEIAGHARDEGLEAAANMNSTPSQTMGTESQRKAAGKRPATQQAGGPAKKPRQSRLAPQREIVNLDDDDDDDELKFRRRRR